jgi:predicted small lipoprotein YifL
MRRALVLLLLTLLAAAGCGTNEGPKRVRLPPQRLPPPREHGR